MKDSGANIRARNYRARLLSEDNWLRLADALLTSAEALQPLVDRAHQARRVAAKKEPFIWPAETDAPIAIQAMLFSFALENLLKASLVQHNKMEYARQLQIAAKLPKDLKAHDLFRLAIKARKVASAKRELDGDDEELLLKLSRRAVWQGRYPVPVDSEDLRGLITLQSGRIGSVTAEMSRDPWDVKRLIHELCNDLRLPFRRDT